MHHVAVDVVDFVDHALHVPLRLQREGHVLGRDAVDHVFGLVDGAHDIAHVGADFIAEFGGALGELAHFVGDDGEASPGFTGTRRFDGGIERQQVGLAGDAFDLVEDLLDLAELQVDLVHLVD
ncbi:hypothetical protein GALL_443210 [mine drainage metagenome]|uniref:Uncharacterized protein n=1 Tax=mine drainage metagenome TaxID=410659 RepID=A0A1J5PSC4_9ZZZZ